MQFNINAIFSKKNMIDFFYMTLGSLLTAVSIELFMIPAKIAPGGISGFANILYNITGFPVNYIYFLLNIPLFVVGYLVIGFGFIIKSIITNVEILIFCELLKPFESGLTQDMLFNSILCGLVGGIGVGLTIYAGANTGGTDIIAIVLNHYIKFITIGQYLLVIDFIIIFLLLIFFKNFELMMYSIICVYIMVKAIDLIILGPQTYMSINIISDNHKEISDEIVSILNKKPSKYDIENKSVSYFLHKKDISSIKTIALDKDLNSLIYTFNIKDIIDVNKKQSH